MSEQHPVSKQLRDLRHARGESLEMAGRRLGIPPVVIGSYERGERNPPLLRLEEILNQYGYTLVAIPKDFDAIRLTGNIVRELRLIASQLENQERTRRKNDGTDHSYGELVDH